MSYQGSCHCGAVTFEVAGDLPDEALSCNCSHCRRKGFLLTFVPTEQLSITAGEGKLSEYRFNQRTIAHRFCTTCGCQPFGTGTGPDGTDNAAINLRCVPGADLDTLIIKHVDGASF